MVEGRFSLFSFELLKYNIMELTGYTSLVFKNKNEITIPADADVVNRGYGAFDFFSIINGKPFYLDRHLDRFFNTMSYLRLKITETQIEVADIIHQVIEKNNITDFHMKLFAYPKKVFHGDVIDCNLFVIPVIMPSSAIFDVTNGVKLIAKEYQRFLPEAKSTNYMPMVYWHHEIHAAGAVDVLYYSEGDIRESSRGNVFVVKDGKVRTPDKKMLKGITRSIAIDILKKQNIPVLEEPVSLQSLFTADEVFLTSTTKRILPIIQVDEHIVQDGKPGTIAKLLLGEFEKIKEGWNK